MFLSKFFKSLSVNEEIKKEVNSNIIMDNVIGVMPIVGGAGATTISSNIAYILSMYNLISNKKTALTDFIVCVLDLDVINPKQYQVLLSEVPEKNFGLMNVFNLGVGEVSRNIHRISSTLSLLTASPKDDIYEYFDITAENVSDTIDYLKNHFDLVIVDIPNNIQSPLCYQAIKSCSKVFSVWNESPSIKKDTKRLISFLEEIKIQNKFTSVIFNKKTNTALAYDHINTLAKELGLDLLSVIPYEQKIVNSNLNGDLYFNHGIINKHIKRSYMDICSSIIDIKLSDIISGGKHEKMAN